MSFWVQRKFPPVASVVAVPASGDNVVVLLMMLDLTQELESPENPGRFNVPERQGNGRHCSAQDCCSVSPENPVALCQHALHLAPSFHLGHHKVDVGQHRAVVAEGGAQAEPAMKRGAGRGSHAGFLQLEQDLMV